MLTNPQIEAQWKILVDTGAQFPGLLMDFARAIEREVSAQAPTEKAELVACNTQIASDAIDAALKERDYPANPKNAARAGWEACLRINATPIPCPACGEKDALLKAQQEGSNAQWHGMNATIAQQAEEIARLTENLKYRAESHEANCKLMATKNDQLSAANAVIEQAREAMKNFYYSEPYAGEVDAVLAAIDAARKEKP